MQRNKPKLNSYKIKQQNLSFVQMYSLSGVLLKYSNGVKAAFAMRQRTHTTARNLRIKSTSIYQNAAET